MAAVERQGTREVRCELNFAVVQTSSIVLQLAVAATGVGALVERLDIDNAGRRVSGQELPGQPVRDGRQRLFTAEPGPLRITYTASFTVGASQPATVTALERIVAMRPSRYCPSDRMAGFGYATFGRFDGALDRVRAICDYVHSHLTYQVGSSDGSTDASQTLLGGQGVCRDYAHLVTALCRAVDVPARVAAVYAPGLSPMDMHLVVETEIDGVWRVWDATRLAPRPSLIRMATGRDAADVAFATVLTGLAELTGMEVVAVVGGDLPEDDHHRLMHLR
jgi:hypothetical protein